MKGETLASGTRWHGIPTVQAHRTRTAARRHGQWERAFRVNIFSYFWSTRAALKHLPEGGCLINTSSINGLRGNKAVIDYVAAG